MSILSICIKESRSAVLILPVMLSRACLACEFLGKVSDNKLTQKVPKEILSRPKTVNESSNLFILLNFQCVLCYIISINDYFSPSPFVVK